MGVRDRVEGLGMSGIGFGVSGRQDELLDRKTDSITVLDI